MGSQIFSDLLCPHGSLQQDYQNNLLLLHIGLDKRGYLVNMERCGAVVKRRIRDR